MSWRVRRRDVAALSALGLAQDDPSTFEDLAGISGKALHTQAEAAKAASVPTPDCPHNAPAALLRLR